MTVTDSLEKLLALTKKNAGLKDLLLETQEKENPVDEFCRIARDNGCELYPMELVMAGQEFYAAIRRSTNGGGENSPKLEGEDNFYEMFLAELKYIKCN